MRIGPYELTNNLILAPMAGVTDAPFRQLCKQWGAGLAVSEMVSSNSLLWGSDKTRRRATFFDADDAPRSVQIVGSDPALMAQAAQMNVDNGAQIIDINMGCPAKKICNVMAGSALLQNEGLVREILEAVTNTVDVPVTLKIRTGWDTGSRNGANIARIAEQSGIQALAVHGRTRACGYRGDAEYDTIAAIKVAVTIPVIANGDITSPEKAKFVLDYTGVDAVMIGRAAQGRPWIFRDIAAYIETGRIPPQPTAVEIKAMVLDHLQKMYDFYGEYTGVRMARKHLSWFSKGQVGASEFRHRVNRLQSSVQQINLAHEFFDCMEKVA
ncbi:MAG: tRNA dihydrouridine synthase DusB [Gammaproteobacteria bacterium]|nr:tRNA dihydrouridine synthase DusB [Gammaproteobacteria bacterium]